jgi:hypothetical protein
MKAVVEKKPLSNLKWPNPEPGQRHLCASVVMPVKAASLARESGSGRRNRRKRHGVAAARRRGARNGAGGINNGDNRHHQSVTAAHV